ncbi:MAG TPA: ATP-binding protein, partial [Armatimonadota bacterium]|nr:ATP-binding protein [Armatimonadota bacterium]
LGSVAMYHREPRGPAPTDLTLSQVATQVARIAIERARAEALLRERAEELAERDRRKDEFLAMLAHELRNPLAPIRTAVRILQRQGPPDPLLTRNREIVERQVEKMARLLNDLLDVSRITRGMIDLHREKLDLAEVVKDSVEACRPLIEERGHTLNLSQPGAPITAEADRIRVDQILTNLLTNAAKYTDPGGAIHVSLARENGRAILRVTDTGRGIEPELIPHVFELFRQGRRNLDRSQGGLGIGLTLVKSLVEMHGGTVHAESAGADRGAIFSVYLPAAEEPAAAGRPGEDTAPSNATARPGGATRVLVVDDNRDAAEVQAEALRLSGYDVHVAFDGLAAIEAARTYRPHVALLDIGLPRMNGYEVARRLRAHPDTAAIPLVAVTGYGQDQDREEAHRAGFSRYMIKPVDPDELERAIRSLASSAEHGDGRRIHNERETKQ